MKKSWMLLVGLFILLIMISLISGVRINEVMADPSRCSDTHCEYIEIYSSSPINLTNWNINTTNQDSNFDFYLEDYLIITRNKDVFIHNFSVDENKVIELDIGLINSAESVFLFNNNSELIDDFTYSDTTAGISWQYCSGDWFERNPTPGSSNNCSTPDNNNNPPENTEDAQIYLEIDWNDDEIINGEEFEIEIKAFNLEYTLYNIKVWIEFKNNDTVISDRYDKEAEEWKSGKYYVDDFFEGPGDETEDIKLRIREDYKDFYDRAKIFFKIEGGDEEYEYIEILERDEEPIVRNLNVSNNPETFETTLVTVDVIKLGTPQVLEQTEDIKTQDNIVYKSKTELIKKYSVYAFALLCVGICVLLAFKRLE